MSRQDPKRPPVSRADLEARLAGLRAELEDPRAGLFGPGSKLWEVNRHSVVFLGAGRAALLQLAHPHVAWAIEQHSRTRDDPLGRFQRTFAHVFAMVFGDWDEAAGSARVVHAVHARIRGEIPVEPGPAVDRRYRANRPESLLWVHATLWDTSVQVYEALVRPLDADEKAAYYAETRRFAALFGIPEDVLPADWEAFRAYVQEMLEGDALRVTAPARRMARFLLTRPHPVLVPLLPGYRLVTAHLLPERLARGFGLARGGEPGRRAHEAMLGALRVAWPRLPRRLRFLPAYVAAERRLAGRTDRDWIGEQLSRVLVGGGP